MHTPEESVVIDYEETTIYLGFDIEDVEIGHITIETETEYEMDSNYFELTYDKIHEFQKHMKSSFKIRFDDVTYKLIEDWLDEVYEFYEQCKYDND